jgi:hypothetical protein
MKITLLKTIIVAVSVFGIASSPAATILFTDTLPTLNVVRSNTTVSAAGNLQVRNIGATPTANTRWVGFGFSTTSAVSLDKVTFFIYNDIVSSGALGATMTISVVSLASLTASPSTPYTPLYSETATVPATYGNENYMTFDLTSSYSLAADSNYGVMVYFNSNASNRGINFTQSPSSTGGIGGVGDLFYTTDLGATYTNTSAPLNFVIQTVPEPSTALLVLLGGTYMMGVYRSRKRQAKA